MFSVLRMSPAPSFCVAATPSGEMAKPSASTTCCTRSRTASGPSGAKRKRVHRD